MNEMIPLERIENKIYLIRGQKVMLDKDLAELYGVPTKVFNQAVKRNSERFPADFIFQLTWEEIERLRSQIVTLKLGPKQKRGKHLKYLPYAFTEQGVAMLSSVLKSKQAVGINILIIRAFVKLRLSLSTNKELVYMVKELRQKVGQHDKEIGLIIRTIEKMISFEKKPRVKIGFNVEKEHK
jgi:hypothetical protein